MPIDRAKLSEPQPPLGKQIIEFLQEEPEQAFSCLEIMSHIQGCEPITLIVCNSLVPGTQKTLDEQYGECLQKLEDVGVAISAVDKAVRYYALADTGD